ncbi:phosphopantothenoylcysteine decarboxylase isoform X2 [Octopus vulgaris]|uniref:Phosphopantothenoylcysteine decarboxylase isoform X2 n=1 Tax=Octopus vulgaris TaxID=6645 RepID=A0AA36BI37_OCTVU|nr:phosphopantothenoylcysteine decarboxylase isoform X2 [Octopus vulgaris]
MATRSRVLIACTGSVAAVKIPLLIKQLQQTDPTWNNIGDPILHIELRRWADIMVICPLDANTLAKIANGLCDNLLTCIVRAWDQKKPLLFAPAMNTLMWEHVITKKQIETLTGFGYIEIPCVAKKLACADVGKDLNVDFWDNIFWVAFWDYTKWDKILGKKRLKV